ncbi:MAG TPA: hypothetical protein VJM76_03625 [Gammaproteobacteria bacterium]|nr:hypothetical protein [Gammaproteobacteria bacterium]
MRFLTALMLVLILECAFGLTTASAERLVLVTSANTNLPALTNVEVRRLFLGKPLVKDGVRIEGLRNTSDELLQEVFLQKVVFMSVRAYERQLLSNVFREGGERPADYKEVNQLLNALQEKYGTLTYMWANVAQATPGVKIIGELWEGSLQ